MDLLANTVFNCFNYRPEGCTATLFHSPATHIPVMFVREDFWQSPSALSVPVTAGNCSLCPNVIKTVFSLEKAHRVHVIHRTDSSALVRQWEPRAGAWWQHKVATAVEITRGISHSPGRMARNLYNFPAICQQACENRNTLALRARIPNDITFSVLNNSFLPTRASGCSTYNSMTYNRSPLVQKETCGQSEHEKNE